MLRWVACGAQVTRAHGFAVMLVSPETLVAEVKKTNRAALGIKDKVADFVGYNAKQNRWLIAERKGGNLSDAFDQLSNTVHGSLTADVWEHIVTEHGYMAPYFDAIQQTIIAPDEIYFDPASTRNRKTGAQVYAYYKSHILSGLFQDNLAFVSVKFVPESSGLHG